MEVELAPGESFISLPIEGSLPGEVTITALAPGLETAAISFPVNRQELEVVINAPPASLPLGATVNIAAEVTSGGSPPPGIQVEWNAPSLRSDAFIDETDEDGLSRFTFIASAEGVIELTIVATHPAFVEARDRGKRVDWRSWRRRRQLQHRSGDGRRSGSRAAYWLPCLQHVLEASTSR